MKKYHRYSCAGFANKVCAFSKNFLIAALIKKNKVHLVIFRDPLQDQHLPRSPLIQRSLHTFASPFLAQSLFLCDFLCSVPWCLLSRAVTTYQLFLLCAEQTPSFPVSVRLFRPLHTHLTVVHA